MNIHIPEALIIPKTEQGNNFLTKFKNKYFVKINNIPKSLAPYRRLEF